MSAPFSRCQWTSGTPDHRDDSKCGLPTAPGSPYCEARRARAWRRKATAGSETDGGEADADG